MGFLSGGSAKQLADVPEEERPTRREEAFARATVGSSVSSSALGPLDMRGPTGVATVIGSLQHGLRPPSLHA